ncbi:MAG TPA: hypothetical protein EYH09_00395 [Candidatus Nanopusillus sp.]|nr:hypothetical protein [Candidatus Nanopusillus sp.]
MVFNIFKRKKKKEEDKEKKNDVVGTCVVCNQPVRKIEDYRILHFQGQKIIMHKKCFKQMKKLARQFLKGGLTI